MSSRHVEVHVYEVTRSRLPGARRFFAWLLFRRAATEGDGTG